MPVNPSNKRLRASKATANDKITINGVEYGSGAKAGQPNRIGVRLANFRLFPRSGDTGGNCGCGLLQFKNPNRQSGQ
jgi:hypothetical protein